MPSKKKILLIEPNYQNKFPPVGLMKLATYYKNRKWEVVFFKGDLKLFVIERITDKLIEDLKELDESINWLLHKRALFDYLRTRQIEFLHQIPFQNSEFSFVIENIIFEARDEYWKGYWKDKPEWDRVGITTLFTFYWDITIETINFAKDLVKNKKNLMVGGVLASIQPDEIEAATGICPHVGLLNTPGILDKGDTQIIDELELDYSILDEIEYKYPMSNAYYRYTTRGCIRKCSFCAVSTLEPQYQSYIPLKERLDKVAKKYGPQKDLLLMDNNVLASENFPQIIEEIKACGFAKGATFQKIDLLKLSINNLKKGINDRAYKRKTWELLREFYNTLKEDESYQLYCIFEKYHLDDFFTVTKENLLSAYEACKELYEKKFKPGKGRKRYVDFNQGVDARLFNSENAKLLGSIAIKPLRIAFDDIKTTKSYVNAVRLSAKAGIHDFSNYLLYNFKDKPDDLYERMRINVELCEELDVSIYSFPMKYHPIRKTKEMDEDYSHNRDYIGEHWNRKYIRCIQAILNATKGKVGRGESFFHKAFGKNLEDYHKLLEMPETMIIYRLFFDWLGTKAGKQIAKKTLGSDLICKNSTNAWWELFNNCKNSLDNESWAEVKKYIHINNFEISCQIQEPQIQKMLKFYELNKKLAVEQPGTELNKLKNIFDKNFAREFLKSL